jgi:hypothetical protein
MDATVPLSDLYADPSNARLYPPRSRAATLASLVCFGAARPIVAVVVS